MAVSEKIISDFEHEVSKAYGEGWDYVDLSTEDAKEILELLKEQEAVKPILVKLYPHDVYRCGNCGHCAVGTTVPKTYRPKYCPECGRKVKWDAVD